MLKKTFFVLTVLSSLVLKAGQKEFSGFDLIEKQNKVIKLSPNEKGFVLVFLSAKCPCSHSHIRLLNDIKSEYSDFQFLAIHSNQDEKIELASDYFKSVNLNFKVIHDNKATIANQLSAFKTPHVFVMNASGEIIYQGGVTNSAQADRADQIFLREVLEDLKNNKVPRYREKRTLGCIINREEE